jgi:hypothetical protein
VKLSAPAPVITKAARSAPPESEKVIGLPSGSVAVAV